MLSKRQKQPVSAALWASAVVAAAGLLLFSVGCDGSGGAGVGGNNVTIHYDVRVAPLGQPAADGAAESPEAGATRRGRPSALLPIDLDGDGKPDVILSAGVILNFSHAIEQHDSGFLAGATVAKPFGRLPASQNPTPTTQPVKSSPSAADPQPMPASGAPGERQPGPPAVKPGPPPDG